MAERPILFPAPMVKALLADLKTQTRKNVKTTVSEYIKEPRSGICRHPDDPFASIACPYGQPGDRLWVKETWKADQIWDAARPLDIPEGEAILYTADEHATRVVPYGWGRWRPSIFMRRWMSRLTLELTDVRVERLNEISEEDAIAEGIDVFSDGAGYTVPLPDGKLGPWQRNPVDAYRNIWESINGAGSWSANPWVWALTFRSVEARHG